MDLRKSLVLISSKSPTADNNFGTGFVIHEDEQSTIIVTCAHVVTEVGGGDSLLVSQKTASIIASGERDGIDLTVLRVERLFNKTPLLLCAIGKEGGKFCIAGYQPHTENKYIIEELNGELGKLTSVESVNAAKPYDAWHLVISSENKLQPGYSGSPVVDMDSNYVLGVASDQKGSGQRGTAISIEGIREIWPDIPPGLIKPVSDVLKHQTAEPVHYESQIEIDANSSYRKRFQQQGLISRRVKYLAISTTVLALISTAVIYRKYIATRPLTTVAFSDDFDVFNASRWNMPPAGFAIKSDGRLHIESAPAISFPKGINYRNFIMTFHLKLTNSGGAAWAVRVKGPTDYYLFYLSGPEGMFPGRFNVYIVRNDKFDPKDHYDSQPANINFRAAGQYDVVITAEGSTIDNKIIPADTGKPVTLYVLKDQDDVFSSGSIGFRTVGAEKFSIDELNIKPPEVQMRTRR
jgi:trypsin-like peptidase